MPMAHLTMGSVLRTEEGRDRERLRKISARQWRGSRQESTCANIVNGTVVRSGGRGRSAITSLRRPPRHHPASRPGAPRCRRASRACCPRRCGQGRSCLRTRRLVLLYQRARGCVACGPCHPSLAWRPSPRRTTRSRAEAPYRRQVRMPERLDHLAKHADDVASASSAGGGGVRARPRPMISPTSRRSSISITARSANTSGTSCISRTWPRSWRRMPS